MTIIRCIDNDISNTRMTDEGYEIIAVETYRWNDGHTETEILWAKEEQPVDESELPY